MPTSFPMSNPWVHGEDVDEIDMNARVTVPINDLAATFNWQAWTPVLTAATTNPTLGTGSSTTGRYIKSATTVMGWGSVFFGTSGAAAGTGIYGFSLPAAASLSTPVTAIIGTGLVKAAGGHTHADIFLSTSTTVSFQVLSAAVGGTAVTVTNANPGVFTNNDYLKIWFTYEAA